MIVHEIAAVRKGRTLGRKLFELTVVANDKRNTADDGDPSDVEINATLHIDVSSDRASELFGDDYDIGTRVTLADITFTRSEEDAA